MIGLEKKHGQKKMKKMTEYNAFILKINENDEYEVLLDINGIKITCFASICPYPIEVGKQYNVALSLWTAEGFYPQEVSLKQANAIVQNGTGFGYTLTGILEGNVLDCGIKLKDEDNILATEYQYLSGTKVQIYVDRINIEFL